MTGVKIARDARDAKKRGKVVTHGTGADALNAMQKEQKAIYGKEALVIYVDNRDRMQCLKMCVEPSLMA